MGARQLSVSNHVLARQSRVFRVRFDVFQIRRRCNRTVWSRGSRNGATRRADGAVAVRACYAGLRSRSATYPRMTVGTQAKNPTVHLAAIIHTGQAHACYTQFVHFPRNILELAGFASCHAGR